MSDIKWIKLTTDMFDNRKIKHIRKLPEGNNIVLIWIMLLTMAGRCNSCGMIFLTENIPYTMKMLADELGFDESVIQMAMGVLEHFGMIVCDHELLTIPGWEEHQNVEGMERVRALSAARSRKYRGKQKTPLLPEIKPNGDKNSHDKPKNEITYSDEFEEFWKVYPLHKEKGNTYAKYKARVKQGFSHEDLLLAAQKYAEECKASNKESKFIKHGVTFLSDKLPFVDYLKKEETAVGGAVGSDGEWQ